MTDSLLELLAVEPAKEADTFIGQPEDYGPIGVYGGHLVGQALAAGLETVDEPKLAHSLHCYFLRPGDPETPIQYVVERLREGRGSDVRNITGLQHGRKAFQMTASFKLPEPGDEHQPQMPEVDHPEVLQQAILDGGMSFNPPPTTKGRMQMLLASEHFMQPEYTPDREPVLKVWTRCASDRPLTDREAQIVLAFLSDGTLMFNSVIPYGVPFRTHRLTSIDHVVWFHTGCDVTEWMLFDQHSSAAGDGRGLNHGTLFGQDGRLVMTVAQESLLRRG